MNKKHIYTMLLLIATLLLVACPQPTYYKGSTKGTPLTVSNLLGRLAKAVDMPDTTPKERKEKQKNIQNLLIGLKRLDPQYKHKPKTKDDLIILIKAEVWGQGTGGAPNWQANLNNIDTSQITDMAYLFSMHLKNGYGLHQFNGLINKWDVSKVTNMWGMFYNARVFNQPINEWDVSSVTKFTYTFYNAKAFNQDLNAWDEHLQTAGVYRKIKHTQMFKGSPMHGNNKPAWVRKIKP